MVEQARSVRELRVSPIWSKLILACIIVSAQPSSFSALGRKILVRAWNTSKTIPAEVQDKISIAVVRNQEATRQEMLVMWQANRLNREIQKLESKENCIHLNRIFIFRTQHSISTNLQKRRKWSRMNFTNFTKKKNLKLEAQREAIFEYEMKITAVKLFVDLKLTGRCCYLKWKWANDVAEGNLLADTRT